MKNKSVVLPLAAGLLCLSFSHNSSAFLFKDKSRVAHAERLGPYAAAYCAASFNLTQLAKDQGGRAAEEEIELLAQFDEDAYKQRAAEIIGNHQNNLRDTHPLGELFSFPPQPISLEYSSTIKSFILDTRMDEFKPFRSGNPLGPMDCYDFGKQTSQLRLACRARKHRPYSEYFAHSIGVGTIKFSVSVPEAAALSKRTRKFEAYGPDTNHALVQLEAGVEGCYEHLESISKRRAGEICHRVKDPKGASLCAAKRKPANAIGFKGQQVFLIENEDTRLYSMPDGYDVVIYLGVGAHINGANYINWDVKAIRLLSPDGKELLREFIIPEKFDGYVPSLR